MSLASFGEFFQSRKLHAGLSLRQFCIRHKFNPSNISKLERGRSAMAEDENVLRRYAEALSLVEGSEEWRQFFDLAYACNGIIPPDLLTDDEVVTRLPVIYRTLRGESITEEQFNNLVEIIRRN